MEGGEWEAPAFFDKVGPLPRCAVLQPRIYLAGRQVQLTKELLNLLAATDVVVNADWLDRMHGTSGGNAGRPCQDRHSDVEGVRYLKCDIPDCQDTAELPEILGGTAEFLQCCANNGGVAVVYMHGQSRSAAVICAFLMASRNVPLDSAWQIFEETKIRIDPSLVWWDALRNFQARSHKRAIADISPNGV